ncbi:MAG: hypothetical protein K6D37_07965 [Prevotella sp.]|nr:hypothetical protein [Prevotella sp.]
MHSELCTLNYALPLLATIVIEYGVLRLLLEKRSKVLWASVAINILTNVPLNIFVNATHAAMGGILLCELLVMVIETLWYRLFGCDMRQAAVYGVLCNATSFLTGLLTQLCWGLL